MDPQPTLDAMDATAHVLASGDVREQLHALQTLSDAVDGAKASLLADLDASKDYEIDGAATLNAWVRNRLRASTKQASILVRNAQALRDLHLVAEAALTGQIGSAHVQAFAYGLKHVGVEVMRQHEQVLVEVALENGPGELFEVVKHLKDVLHPEHLDEKWKDGMDKEDFAVDAVPDGWHVTGFLNTTTGAKLKRVLDSISAPHDKHDDRSGAQRRVQGLDDLLSSILANGLPDDKGVKPHMTVYADADTVAAAAERVKQETEKPWRTPEPMPDVEPATLAGHGHVGPHLLMYFLCISDVTAFLMKAGDGRRQDQVLNAGRTRRLATQKQRLSVLARQKGVCATPGCYHTHLEIHHTVWYSRGGRTDLDLLVGLCVRCHHLLHRGGLHITGDAVSGFVFTNRDHQPLRRRRRSSYRRAA